MKHFTKKRIAKQEKVIAGVGTIVVPIPFVPNFIQVDYADMKHNAQPDTLEWSLTVAAYGYDLTIDYSCNEERNIRYVVAKLPKDPEQTISFG